MLREVDFDGTMLAKPYLCPVGLEGCQLNDRLIKAAETETWSCGAAADMTSNANGLVAGNKYGGVYGTMKSVTTSDNFPYSSLVASLDGGKSFFGRHTARRLRCPGENAVFVFLGWQ